MNFNPVYVNCVLLSDDFENIVFLHKTSGPSFLLNKYNYVGGKQEPGEETIESIHREVKEEAGILVDHSLFFPVTYKEFERDGKFYKLENFGAIVPQTILSKAHTAEKEEVFFRNIKDVLMNVLTNPQDFNDDFKEILKNALNAVPEDKRNKNHENLLFFVSERERKFSFISKIKEAQHESLLKEESRFKRENKI